MLQIIRAEATNYITMPFWLKSSKRSGADTGKYSSPITHSSSNYTGPSHCASPPQSRSVKSPRPIRPYLISHGRPTTSHPTQHRNVTPVRDRPSTSHTPARYPSHRSISPLGTSRFEKPSPYTFTRGGRQESRPQQFITSRRPHVVEVPRMGDDGYFGATMSTRPR